MHRDTHWNCSVSVFSVQLMQATIIWTSCCTIPWVWVLPPSMPQGKPISEDIQWIIICLSTNLSPKDVSMCTNVSECKVCTILAHHKKTGEVVIPKHEKLTLCRKLQEENLQVFLLFLFYHPFYFTDSLQHLYKTLSSKPDVHFDELQLELIEKHGVEAAIWRTLVKGGYTMKKVCETDQLHMSDVERSFSFLTQHLNRVWRSTPYSQLV